MIDPLPLPAPGGATTTQSAVFATLQAHVGADAVIVTVPAPPSGGGVAPVGAIEKVQGGGGGGAACITVNVCPATVSVPVRAAPVFAATVNVTLPFPTPFEPPVIAIHASLVAAVHEHVGADAVTAVDPGPPVSGTF